MKKKSFKKVLAFIITIMVFSALPQLATAQKDKPCPPGYKLKCYSIRPPFCLCIRNGDGKNIDYNAKSKELVATTFELENPSIVSIKIYDATGRLVKTITDKRTSEGDHQLEWDKNDESGKAVPAGVYVLRLNAKNYAENKKILIVK